LLYRHIVLQGNTAKKSKNKKTDTTSLHKDLQL